MSDQIELRETAATQQSSSAKGSRAVEALEVTQEQEKGRLKGWLPMAICCGTPLLLLAGVSLFGFSLGPIANGFLSLAAVLACPLGMYLMMRMMMNKK